MGGWLIKRSTLVVGDRLPSWSLFFDLNKPVLWDDHDLSVFLEGGRKADLGWNHTHGTVFWGFQAPTLIPPTYMGVWRWLIGSDWSRSQPDKSGLAGSSLDWLLSWWLLSRSSFWLGMDCRGLVSDLGVLYVTRSETVVFTKKTVDLGRLDPFAWRESEGHGS